MLKRVQAVRKALTRSLAGNQPQPASGRRPLAPDKKNTKAESDDEEDDSDEEDDEEEKPVKKGKDVVMSSGMALRSAPLRSNVTAVSLTSESPIESIGWTKPFPRSRSSAADSPASSARISSRGAAMPSASSRCAP